MGQLKTMEKTEYQVAQYFDGRMLQIEAESKGGGGTRNEGKLHRDNSYYSAVSNNEMAFFKNGRIIKTR